MAKKILYAVRHGLSMANIEDRGQGLNDPLSPEGERQAEKLAMRASSLDFEVLLASDAVRAVETATIIAKRTNHTLVTNPIFRERKGPSSLVGVARSDPRYTPYLQMIRSPEVDAHFDDEENFFEMKARCIEAMNAIESMTEEKIFLVSHGLFLKMLTALVILNKHVAPDQWLSIYFETMRDANTGLSMFEIDDGLWTLLTWNDHSHLAD